MSSNSQEIGSCSTVPHLGNGTAEHSLQDGTHCGTRSGTGGLLAAANLCFQRIERNKQRNKTRNMRVPPPSEQGALSGTRWNTKTSQNSCSPDWDDPNDVRARFHELSGFHLSAGKTQEEADKLAHEALVVDWMNSHPVEVTEGCPHCGAPHDDTSMPYLNGEAVHVKVHGRCWLLWQAGLWKRAQEALERLGIPALT